MFEGFFRPKADPIEQRNPHYTAAVRMLFNALVSNNRDANFNKHVGKYLSQDYQDITKCLARDGIKETMRFTFKVLTTSIEEGNAENAPKDEWSLRMYGYMCTLRTIGRATIAYPRAFVSDLNLSEFEIATKMCNNLREHYEKKPGAFCNGAAGACADLVEAAHTKERELGSE